MPAIQGLLAAGFAIALLLLYVFSTDITLVNNDATRANVLRANALRSRASPRIAILVLGSLASPVSRRRLIASRSTWMRHALAMRSAHVTIFLALGPEATLPLDLIPPQLSDLPRLDVPDVDYDNLYIKTFAAFQQLHDNYLNEFDWFMKADDDTYVRAEALARLLAKHFPIPQHSASQETDAAHMHLVGHAEEMYVGQVIDVLRQTSATNRSETVPWVPRTPAIDMRCYGGPGYMLSRPLLRKLGPRLGDCTARFPTAEDVAMGMCVNEYVAPPPGYNSTSRDIYHGCQNLPVGRHGHNRFQHIERTNLKVWEALFSLSAGNPWHGVLDDVVSWHSVPQTEELNGHARLENAYLQSRLTP